MIRILGPALLIILSPVVLMAAKNSQTFFLSADVRAGKIQLPRGICEVTWDTPARTQVELAIKAEDRKTITVPVRVIEGKQDRTGVVTSVIKGVTYLEELRTRNARFIFQTSAESPK